MKTIAFDLDGTLVSWKHDPATWGQPLPVGEWLPGAQDVLHDLARDYRILVHSCRATWPGGGGWKAIADLLEAAEFDVALVVDAPGSLRDDVNRCESWHDLRVYKAATAVEPTRVGIWLGTGKPIASVYVDDRGFHFPGEWTPDLLNAIRALAIA